MMPFVAPDPPYGLFASRGQLPCRALRKLATDSEYAECMRSLVDSQSIDSDVVFSVLP